MNLFPGQLWISHTYAARERASCQKRFQVLLGSVAWAGRLLVWDLEWRSLDDEFAVGVCVGIAGISANQGNGQPYSLLVVDLSDRPDVVAVGEEGRAFRGDGHEDLVSVFAPQPDEVPELEVNQAVGFDEHEVALEGDLRAYFLVGVKLQLVLVFLASEEVAMPLVGSPKRACDPVRSLDFCERNTWN